MNADAERRIRNLNALLELSAIMASQITMDDLLLTIVEKTTDVMQAERSSLFLLEKETDELWSKIAQGLEIKEIRFPVGVGIAGEVAKTRKFANVPDANDDPRFNRDFDRKTNYRTRSLLCMPLTSNNDELLGVVQVLNKSDGSIFDAHDEQLLSALASHVVIALERQRLLTSHMQKLKQDSELSIARNVQRALLPDTLPTADGYEFYASYDAAQAVGGDYYDGFLLDDTRICFAFGDVAGKGVPGALIMSRLSSVVKSTMAFVYEVGEAATAINNHMCDTSVEGRFVTFVLLIIDLKTHEMSLVNAGHMSPMIRKTNGRIEEFDDETIGLPIGIVEGYPFHVVRRAIEPGEVIVIFTDGVDEAMNPNGELYGLDRMRTFIAGNRLGPSELGRELLEDVRKHANGRAQNDDITIMTIGRSS